MGGNEVLCLIMGEKGEGYVVMESGEDDSTSQWVFTSWHKFKWMSQTINMRMH